MKSLSKRKLAKSLNLKLINKKGEYFIPFYINGKKTLLFVKNDKKDFLEKIDIIKCNTF